MQERPTPTASPSATMTLTAYVAASRERLLIVALTVFGMYLPTVIVPYAFSDDYSFLWMADSREPSPQFGKNILDASAIGGRPIAGLISDLFFSTAGTIDNLRFMRLFGLIGIVALALLLNWALVRSGVQPTAAALVSVLVCSLPAFEVF